MDSNSKCQHGVDRISALSDALVRHILSFLPTIYAVWTSLLSSRWNNLWNSLPNVDFDDEDFHTKRTDRFMKIVGRVLSSRGSSDIRKLRLHIHHCEFVRTSLLGISRVFIVGFVLPLGITLLNWIFFFGLSTARMMSSTCL